MKGLLANVSLWLGEGRDDFKMKRGSFSYKRKLELTELKAASGAFQHTAVQQVQAPGREPEYATYMGEGRMKYPTL